MKLQIQDSLVARLGASSQMGIHHIRNRSGSRTQKYNLANLDSTQELYLMPEILESNLNQSQLEPLQYEGRVADILPRQKQ